MTEIQTERTLTAINCRKFYRKNRIFLTNTGYIFRPFRRTSHAWACARSAVRRAWNVRKRRVWVDGTNGCRDNGLTAPERSPIRRVFCSNPKETEKSATSCITRSWKSYRTRRKKCGKNCTVNRYIRMNKARLPRKSRFFIIGAEIQKADEAADSSVQVRLLSYGRFPERISS